jgi:hypothetical protein
VHTSSDTRRGPDVFIIVHDPSCFRYPGDIEILCSFLKVSFSARKTANNHWTHTTTCLNTACPRRSNTDYQRKGADINTLLVVACLPLSKPEPARTQEPVQTVRMCLARGPRFFKNSSREGSRALGSELPVTKIMSALDSWTTRTHLRESE